MASAIVAGATGMLGRAIVHELGAHQDQWKKVYAITRSKSEDFAQNVTLSQVDLTASAEKMAGQLKDIKVEYVFFAAYLQKDTEQENWDVNGAMVSNFLGALELTGIAQTLKRIILVTGAKQYGLHQGQVKNPMYESDPWLRNDPWEPNFYYRQQDIVRAFCEEHPQVSWVTTYPNDVIGVAKGNFMNLATSLGIYVAVSKELGQQLVFPGGETFYTKFDSYTSSKLHAKFCLWAATEEKAANQAFNVVNGDVESWQSLWPRLAERFGMKVKPDQFVTKTGLEKSTTITDKPPLTEWAENSGLVGTIGESRMDANVDLIKWSQDEKVKKAWNTLAEREGLEKDGLEKATWAFLGFVLGRNYDIVISMSKARALGWTGYVDSWDSFCDAFEELEKEAILPKCR